MVPQCPSTLSTPSTHTSSPRPRAPAGILQFIFDAYPQPQTLGKFASDDEAFAAAHTLQAKHDTAAMKQVKRKGFVGIREPADLAS